MTNLFTELKRRNVFRVAVVYAATSFVILQVADIILPSLGVPGWAMSLIVVLLILGFPAALVMAWALELTPQGIRRVEHSAKQQGEVAAAPALLGKRTVLVSALLIAVGIGLGAGWFLKPGPATLDESTVSQDDLPAVGETYAPFPEEQRSIAVLAFDDMSPNRDKEYLSDGIAEELLNLLSRIQELRVISRSSSFSFKNQNLEIREIGERLNVDHILEGSVRQAGNRVRITAQLIDARNDSHVWSQSYDRTLEDIFAIQDEIAAEVVERLKVTLLNELPAVRETDPEAYQLFLQARHLGHRMTAEAFEHSNSLYRQALEIDPHFADALSGLGNNYSNQAGFGLIPAEKGYARARELAEQALTIDPDHALAHSRLGGIAIRHDNDLVESANHHERALSLASHDVVVLGNAASLLRHMGRLEQAIAVRKSTVVLDPLNPVTQSNLGWDYFYLGRLDKAVDAWEAALRLSPGYHAVHFGIGKALLAKGAHNAARQAFAQEPLGALRLQGLALAAHDLGDMDEFQELRAEFIERWGDQFPSLVAALHAHTGDAALTFEWLDRAVAANRLDYAVLDPVYAPFHEDPRWREFLERTGNTPEELDAIEFEVRLPQQASA